MTPAWLWAGEPRQEVDSPTSLQITNSNTPALLKPHPLLPGAHLTTSVSSTTLGFSPWAPLLPQERPLFSSRPPEPAWISWSAVHLVQRLKLLCSFYSFCHDLVTKFQAWKKNPAPLSLSWEEQHNRTGWFLHKLMLAQAKGPHNPVLHVFYRSSCHPRAPFPLSVRLHPWVLLTSSCSQRAGLPP